MPTATRTFRVFVSSTFDDLRDEGNALAAPGGPFEELTKVCQRYGARFQAVDLRWGVREEAGYDQRTIEICLGEIERCQQTRSSRISSFCWGDRYGWRPLPARIDAAEFQAVRDRIASASDGAEIVSVTADGRRAVSGSWDKTVGVWNLETRESTELRGHTSIVTGVSVTPDGRRAVSGSVDKTLRVWDLETGACLAIARLNARCTGVAVSRDRIVAGTWVGEVLFFDAHGLDL